MLFLCYITHVLISWLITLSIGQIHIHAVISNTIHIHQIFFKSCFPVLIFLCLVQILISSLTISRYPACFLPNFPPIAFQSFPLVQCQCCSKYFVLSRYSVIFPLLPCKVKLTNLAWNVLVPPEIEWLGFHYCETDG